MSSSMNDHLLKGVNADVEVGDRVDYQTRDINETKNILKKLNVMQAAPENRTELDRWI